MSKRTRVATVGVLGFAEAHRLVLQQCEQAGAAELVAVVSPSVVTSVEAELEARGVRVYRTWEALYEKEQGRVDLVTIPCGIHLHQILSVKALEAGYDVYCEKPAAGTLAEVRLMQAAQKATGRNLVIGYQHQFSPVTQRIKTIVLSGELGRLLQARCLL
jgi:predicted dehydrogenase